MSITYFVSTITEPLQNRGSISIKDDFLLTVEVSESPYKVHEKARGKATSNLNMFLLRNPEMESIKWGISILTLTPMHQPQ